ncbi:uncharacterized protein N0V89_011807 [Didymosphaeria variabile]|uniref:Uncharacterized protein n=1 Tax=Didymosphaeria variabile TaxID=1932322 RepID=A0A9W8XCE2_9PLEO|nr:uncharacterized protein N0V89_011807 [Didymosphaeria variabile]KAJ4345672.1 hypothetical protein N0V89_011807 [Didymosphaeria variabile]
MNVDAVHLFGMADIPIYHGMVQGYQALATCVWEVPSLAASLTSVVGMLWRASGDVETLLQDLEKLAANFADAQNVHTAFVMLRTYLGLQMVINLFILGVIVHKVVKNVQGLALRLMAVLEMAYRVIASWCQTLNAKVGRCSCTYVAC